MVPSDGEFSANGPLASWQLLSRSRVLALALIVRGDGICSAASGFGFAVGTSGCNGDHMAISV